MPQVFGPVWIKAFSTTQTKLIKVCLVQWLKACKILCLSLCKNNRNVYKRKKKYLLPYNWMLIRFLVVRSVNYIYRKRVKQILLIHTWCAKNHFQNEKFQSNFPLFSPPLCNMGAQPLAKLLSERFHLLPLNGVSWETLHWICYGQLLREKGVGVGRGLGL